MPRVISWLDYRKKHVREADNVVKYIFIKAILTILIISMIILTASASTTVTINVNRIQLNDEIEGYGEKQADWYYYVGLSNDNEKIGWKSSQTYQDNNDIQLSDSYTFTSTSIQPYILIMLCEADSMSNDDMADISSQTSGSEEEFNNFASGISPSSTERYIGTFKSQYSLKNNQFISGDQIENDGSKYKISGDFDNKIGDENDANLWFSISDNYNQPTVDAGTSKHYKVGDLVNFNGVGTASSGSSIIKYQWDFNNDKTFDAEGQTTSYTYSKARTYTAKLKITDNYGEVATDTVQVTIETIPPIAAFTTNPSEPYTSDTITFTDTSTDQDGTITSWHWDFGDGATSNEKNPTHKYTEDETYNIKLTVTDNDDTFNEKQIDLTVKNIAPTAAFTYSPSKAYINTEVEFTDTSTDQDGTITSWEWDFGDGYTSTNQNPVHKFESNDDFTVKLIITDNDDDSDEFTMSINVYELQPTSTSISTSTSASTPKPISTSKTTSIKSSVVDETIDEESSNSTPGFGMISVTCGFIVLYLIRRKL